MEIMDAIDLAEDAVETLFNLKYGEQKVVEKKTNDQEDCINQKSHISKLKSAVENNELDTIEELLSNKIFTTNAETYNLLKLALKRNYSEVFLVVFNRVMIDNSKTPCNLNKLLFYAAKLENEKPLDTLLQYNVDVCAVNAKKKTALHSAAKNTNRRILHKLLDILMKNVDNLENITDNEGLSLFHIVCTGKNSSYVTKFLENVNVCINDTVSSTSKFCPGYNALHFAAAYYKYDTVKILLEHGAVLDARTSARLSMLHLVCKMTDLKWMLYEALPDNPCSEQRIYGFSKNLENLWQNRWNIIQLLFETGCDPDARDVHGNNALMYAVDMDYELYPHNFVNEKLCCTDEERRYMLHPSQILLDKQLKTIRLILHQYCPDMIDCRHPYLIGDTNVGQILNYKNNLGLTCLHHLASSKCSEPKLTRILFNYGVEVNVAANDFVTPLHLAAKNSTSFILTSLLNFSRSNIDKVAHVDAQDDAGDTPLHYCYRNKYGYSSHNFVALLNCGADVTIANEKGETLLALLRRHIFKVMLDPIFSSQVNMYEELVQNFNLRHSVNHVGYYMTYENIINRHVNVKHIGKIWRYVKMLQLCGRYDDSLNDEFLKKVGDKIHVNAKSVNLRNRFVRCCGTEIKKLKKKRLNNFVSLYDLMSQNINKVASYTRNETLRSILEKEDFNQTYPLYAEIVKARFVRARERYKLLAEALGSLQILLRVKMPEACLNTILSFLTEKKLRDIVEASKPRTIISESTHADSSENYEPSRKIARRDN